MSTRKYEYTEIVKTEVRHQVAFWYHPQGTEYGTEPIMVLITPHQNYVNIHFSNIGGDGRVIPKQTAANGAEIHIVNDGPQWLARQKPPLYRNPNWERKRRIGRRGHKS